MTESDCDRRRDGAPRTLMTAGGQIWIDVLRMSARIQTAALLPTQNTSKELALLWFVRTEARRHTTHTPLKTQTLSIRDTVHVKPNTAPINEQHLIAHPGTHTTVHTQKKQLYWMTDWHTTTN